jgi:hypothetical protein
MDILVGYTGFVGSNLQKQHKFEGLFNSKNIIGAFGSNPDLCVYSGVRAEKFTADRFPEQDLAHIEEALENIRKINPQKLILISTIDVIPPHTGEIFEDTPYSADKLTPYGQNRLFLECEVRKLCSDASIIRLPGLFGSGLKKNFIYDMINFIPAMLKKEKFEELCGAARELGSFYKEDGNGFFRLIPDISGEEREALKDLFKKLGFSALNFTDSRAVFQFYNLSYLWAHIKFAVENDIKLLHLAVEPVSAREVYQVVKGENFVNEITDSPPCYDYFKSRYADKLQGNNGYIFSIRQVLEGIKEFPRKI